MVNRHFITMLCIAGLMATGCSSTKKNATAKSTASLKEVFKNDFGIGTALNAAQIEERDPRAAVLIPQQFNMATPENIMKAEIIHPQWDTYNFDMADKMVAYCKKNGIKINAHTLVWHSQLPAFARRIRDVDSFRTFFTNHIATVAGRYDGKVYSWDVVNEALNEDGTMRKSVFLQKLGDDFVTEAFRLAQSAAPNTQLYYNDYNNEQPAKRAGCIALIKKIQAANAQVFICTPAAIGEKIDFTNSQDGDLNQYSQIIRGIAEKNNVKLIDLRKLFLGYNLANNKTNQPSGTLTTDGVHLNEKGNSLVAEEMLNALTSK